MENTPCSGCGEAKPDSDFYFIRGRRRGKCKVCWNGLARQWQKANPDKARSYSRAWAKRNPEKVAAAQTEWLKTNQYRRRGYGLKANFQMTEAEWDAMLAAQSGLCAICKTDTPGGPGTWAVDHDRACCPGNKSCGRCVRGLLCFACNTGIGKMKDSQDVLRSAIEYLDQYAATRV